MISGKSVLAIIPARQGSKRCPDKNITLFRAGNNYLPLIQHAILHAQSSKYIDTICISSDSDQILTYAKPPIIPIKRPAHLASDSASSEAVIVHALYSTTHLGEPILPFHDLFVLLQPTSPYRTAQDIDSCLERCLASGNRIVSVNESHQRNGAVYASPTLRFLSDLSLNKAESYIMPTARSLDIDYPEDFKTA